MLKNPPGGSSAANAAIYQWEILLFSFSFGSATNRCRLRVTQVKMDILDRVNISIPSIIVIDISEDSYRETLAKLATNPPARTFEDLNDNCLKHIFTHLNMMDKLRFSEGSKYLTVVFVFG